VIWFYKLDTDRDIQGHYPRGWREFDYLVSTATLRSFPTAFPKPAKSDAAPGSWPASIAAPTRGDPQGPRVPPVAAAIAD
jgi:hypothetical protein